jgi:hypothetical protein
VRRALVALLAAALLVAPATTLAKPVKRGRTAAKHVRRDERVRVARSPSTNRPATRPPVVPAPQDPAPKPRPLARVQVIAREFSLTLSRRVLTAPHVGVELDNFGEDPHDLRVERAGDASTGFSFTLAKPGTIARRTLELAPGEWKLYCTLPGHEALGMSARITVTG